MNKIIYKVINMETGQVYIGTTSDLKKRKKDHLQKARTGKGHDFHRAIATYGAEAFQWEQIDSAKSNNEAAEKESNYIFQYHSKEKGFNCDRGGGIKKIIFQFDSETGRLINSYNNLESAAKAVEVDKKSISKACVGELKTCAGYYWSYNDTITYSYLEDKRRKRVYQFTLEHKYLRSFNSVTEASKQTGVDKSSIAKCCREVYKSAGGYTWRYSR